MFVDNTMSNLICVLSSTNIICTISGDYGRSGIMTSSDRARSFGQFLPSQCCSVLPDSVRYYRWATTGSTALVRKLTRFGTDVWGKLPPHYRALPVVPSGQHYRTLSGSTAGLRPALPRPSGTLQVSVLMFWGCNFPSTAGPSR